jgi:hypothetical protein
MSAEYNICPICGGLKEPIPVVYPRSVGICPGHESAPKHDGWLGPKAEGLAPHVSRTVDPWINKPVVRIEHANHPSMDLFPHQALSLRDWLIQESPELERLAKEQSNG